MLTQNPSSNQNYILPKTIPKISPPKAHLTTVAAIHSWSTIKLSVHSYSFQFSHARIARSLTSFVVCANLFIHHTLPLYLSASSDDCRFVHCIIGCQLLLLVHICLTVFHHFRSERSVDRPKTAVSEQPPKTEVMYSASTLHCHWIRHTLHLSSTLECGNCNQPNISVCAPVAVRTERKLRFSLTFTIFWICDFRSIRENGGCDTAKKVWCRFSVCDFFFRVCHEVNPEIHRNIFFRSTNPA